MNVGFADAELAVRSVKQIMQDRMQEENVRKFYNRIRKKSAATALTRAGLMMHLTSGGGKIGTLLRGTGIKTFSIPVFRKIAAGFVSMTSLPSANIERINKKKNGQFLP